MLAAGVNIKAISQSIGYANIGVTLDTYSHLLPGMGKTQAQRFDRLFKARLDCEDVGKMSANDGGSNTRQVLYLLVRLVDLALSIFSLNPHISHFIGMLHETV